MCSADDRVGVYNRHDPQPIITIIWFNNPHSIIWVRVKVGLAEFMDERAFENLFSNHKQKEQVDSGDIEAPCSISNI